MKLLTREEFRRQTLSRFGGRCVVPACSESAVDAHHILNRNLFTSSDQEGGYFLENGSGLCSVHHLDAERTLISTVDLYEWCEIATPAFPHDFDSALEYDTWGNIVREDGGRTRGPLFDNEGCQHALKAGGVLWKFGF